jgi:CelD/BcsL family acetyltransferase involved in cellulose biosynthesis
MLTIHTSSALEHPERWDLLVSDSKTPTVFLTSGWLSAWRETLGKTTSTLFVSVFQQQRLVAAGAFQFHNGVLEFAGKGPSDYADILIQRDVPLERVGDLVARVLNTAADKTPGFRFARLHHIAPGSPLPSVLTDLGFYYTIKSGVEAPVMHMSAARKNLRKKSLRRHEKSLAKVGRLTTLTHHSSATILPRLDAFFDLHVRRWEHVGIASQFKSQSNRDFFVAVTERLHTTDLLRYTEVMLDDKVVAAHFGFMFCGRFTWYKPCFEPELSKQSPGEVLIKNLIELCLDEGAEWFDFTIGNEPFKLRFATDVPCIEELFLTRSALLHLAKRSIEKFRMWQRLK